MNILRNWFNIIKSALRRGSNTGRLFLLSDEFNDCGALPSSSDTSRISSTVSGKLMRCFSVVVCKGKVRSMKYYKCNIKFKVFNQHFHVIIQGIVMFLNFSPWIPSPQWRASGRRSQRCSPTSWRWRGPRCHSVRQRSSRRIRSVMTKLYGSF